MDLPRRIGHYRLEDEVGQGGMGVVYRAWDEDLERWVAIKFIRHERHDSASRQKRFQREAHTVARLVHPAIVQVHHRLPFEGKEGIVMELVEGDSLARLLASGTLSPEKALPILLEVAEGLAYAHGEGFVHRDLKAENIMVTSTGHAKILDFGLAKGPETTTLSEEGSLLGTLHTMSPEQAQALEVDHRTDLFSLGVLLYETLTGTPPFRAANAREALARVIHHHPPPVAESNPDMPRELSELVERLLAKNPAERPQSAAEVASGLARFSDSGSRISLGCSRAGTPTTSQENTLDTLPPTASQHRPPVAEAASTASTEATGRLAWRRGPRLVALGSFALVATLLGLLVFNGNGRPVLVVADFENRTSHDGMGWVGEAVARSLAASLLVDEQLRRPAGDDPDGFRAPVTAADLERLRRGYGAAFVVDGSYTLLEDIGQLTVHFVLRNARTGKVMEEETLTGPQEELLQLVRGAALAFRSRLGVGEVSAEAEAEARALFPTRFETARLYAQALARRSDPGAARDLLEAAAVLEEEHPLIHDALGRALSNLGYVGQAKAAARRAWELSSKLPRRQRLEIEARYHESTLSFDEAARSHRQLFEMFPDEAEIGTRLAQTLIDEGRPEEALELLEDLDDRSTAAVEEGLIGVATAAARLELGELEPAIEVAESAANRARGAEAGFLEARARFVQGDALNLLGRYEEAVAAFERALSLFDQSGIRQGVLSSATRIAIVYADQGKYRLAAQRFEHYREIYRERGDRLTEAILDANLASAWSDRGRLRNAKPLLEGALALLEEVGAHREAAEAAMNLGTVQQELGEMARAQVNYEKTIAAFEAFGDEENLAYARVNLAEVFYWSGELDQAQALLEEVYELHRASGDRLSLAYEGLRLAEILTARDLPDEARRHFDEALEVYTELGQEMGIAETELSYARFELARENIEAARKRAQRAKEIFLDAGVADKAALARLVLARTFLESRTPDLTKAKELHQDAELGAQDGESFQVPIEIALLSAQIAARTSSEARQAATGFEEIAREAAARGLVPYVFEAQLALGELEMRTGASIRGRARLEALATDARHRGFEGVARQAQALLKR